MSQQETSTQSSPVRDHPSGRSTLFGTTVSSIPDLGQKQKEYGEPMPIIGVSNVGLPMVDAWNPEGNGIEGRQDGSVLTLFRADPTVVIEGGADTVLRAYFLGSPRKEYPIYFSFNPEPEDAIATQQYGLSDYLRAWHHIVGLADKIGNPSLNAALILKASTLTTPGRKFRDYVPSGALLDVLAWTVYPTDGYGTPNPQDMFGGPANASDEVQLSFAIAEFGTTTVSGRPKWLIEVGETVEAMRARFCVMTNTPTGPGGRDFQVTDHESIAAWKEVMGTDA